MYPKQFLSLDGERTLLEHTLSRLDIEVFKHQNHQIESSLLVCNEEHRFLVAEQARSCKADISKIVLEPFGRNTAPALTVAALMNKEKDPVLILMPADHKITDRTRFSEAIACAATLAADGYISMLGVTPTSAETGYGYIQYGETLFREDLSVPSFELERFVEKPSLERAEEFLRSGDYLWNSGIFVMKVSVWLDVIKLFSPDTLEACQRAFDKSNLDVNFIRLDPTEFESCPNGSIDFAVMEKIPASMGVVVKLDSPWSDVGSWEGVWDISVKDENDNVIRGDVHVTDTRNSVIFGDHRFISTIDIEDLVVVDTPDALMIASRKSSQAVKSITSWLTHNTRKEGKHHRKVYRPWGSYDTVDQGDSFQVKRIIVNPGHSLSLQLHKHRAEHWIVVRGSAEIIKGEDMFTLAENESTYIPSGVKHRLSNINDYPLEIIEVQSGDYLGEDDIVRFEDKYDRK